MAWAIEMPMRRKSKALVLVAISLSGKTLCSLIRGTAKDSQYLQYRRIGRVELPLARYTYLFE